MAFVKQIRTLTKIKRTRYNKEKNYNPYPISKQLTILAFISLADDEVTAARLVAATHVAGLKVGKLEGGGGGWWWGRAKAAAEGVTRGARARVLI